MRTTWNGAISFGLVTIPIGLAIATEPRAKASDVTFRTLHRECGTPIKQKRWCPFHDREVGPDEVVKGWEVSKGQFVLIEDEELEAIEVDTSPSIDIERFVQLEEIDPIYFDRTYYLAPSSQAAARRPYVLLLAAMRETNMAALGRFVLRGSEKICLIRPYGNALALETLFLAEDIRSKAEIEEIVVRGRGQGRGARSRAPGDRQPRRAVRARSAREPLPAQPPRGLLEAKRAGAPIPEPQPVPEATPSADLLDALRASIAEAKKPAAAAKKPAPKKARASTKKS